MQRRDILKAAALSTLAPAMRPLALLAQPSAGTATAPRFSTSNMTWQHAYDRALQVLAANVQVLPRFNGPVLIEGAEYAGIWQECGPHESLVYSLFRPDVARNTHMTFFVLQHDDGQLPANNKRSETGFGQIQMVVPIAATAWELADATGDSELLQTAYYACSRWDAWLMRYRNTRGTGLIEGFCTYDTGMDNSPRWAGCANQCPDKDARQCPPNPTLPRLCPDLSATVYGGRVALAAMARALGKSSESDQWLDRAESLRKLILEKLYVSEDAAFYDLDAHNNFVKVRSDILSRICGEHVLDQKTFDTLWSRQLGDPHAFWAPYPLPSIALNDPTFVRPIPRNSWGGPSQALTALRAGRWFDHYNRSAEFAHMMQRWCDAILRDPSFRQQIDPLTGEFTQSGSASYSPAALVLCDYTWRLAGVRMEDDGLYWNIRPDCAAAQDGVFSVSLHNGKVAELRYTAGSAELRLGGRSLGRIHGTARLVTSLDGKPHYLLGINSVVTRVNIALGGHSRRQVIVEPNERNPLF
ncbi:MAG TPA: alpha-L-rhamnosidase [Acidobacteriaceae bacterium]|nr:alpha-L-rhamnosidase [Acidobacteriaceae bacterium]